MRAPPPATGQSCNSKLVLDIGRVHPAVVFDLGHGDARRTRATTRSDLTRYLARKSEPLECAPYFVSFSSSRDGQLWLTRKQTPHWTGAPEVLETATWPAGSCHQAPVFSPALFLPLEFKLVCSPFQRREGQKKRNLASTSTRSGLPKMDSCNLNTQTDTFCVPSSCTSLISSSREMGSLEDSAGPNWRNSSLFLSSAAGLCPCSCWSVRQTLKLDLTFRLCWLPSSLAVDSRLVEPCESIAHEEWS